MNTPLFPFFYMKPCEASIAFFLFFAVVDVFVVSPRAVPAGTLALGPEQGRGQGPGGEAQEGRGKVSSSGSRGGAGRVFMRVGLEVVLEFVARAKERHDSRVLELSFCNVCQKKKSYLY